MKGLDFNSSKNSDRLHASSLSDSVDLSSRMFESVPDHAASRSRQQILGPIYLATKTQILVSMRLLTVSPDT